MYILLPFLLNLYLFKVYVRTWNTQTHIQCWDSMLLVTPVELTQIWDKVLFSLLLQSTVTLPTYKNSIRSNRRSPFRHYILSMSSPSWFLRRFIFTDESQPSCDTSHGNEKAISVQILNAYGYNVKSQIPWPMNMIQLNSQKLIFNSLMLWGDKIFPWSILPPWGRLKNQEQRGFSFSTRT